MFPIFNAIDLLFGFMPSAARLGIYGLISGAAAMLIYSLTAPKTVIAKLKIELATAQSALRNYHGTDVHEILRLSRRSITPALKQFLWMLGPTLLGIAPVLILIHWLESTYTHPVWRIGPTWMHSWQTPFFTGLTIATLVMKFVFKIG